MLLRMGIPLKSPFREQMQELDTEKSRKDKGAQSHLARTRALPGLPLFTFKNDLLLSIYV